MKGAYYRDSLSNFLQTSSESLLGILNLANTQFASQWTISSISWESCIQILKKSFTEIVITNTNANNWEILLEYEIPRMQKRIDAVLLADDIIFLIEFKYDRKKFELADIRQVEDYGLDLHDFHKESRDRVIIPILLAPKANNAINTFWLNPENFLCETLKTNAITLSIEIEAAYNKFHNPQQTSIKTDVWEYSVYSPTPTIIQAATALFAGKDVREISNSGADNLSKTTKYIIEIIKKAIANNQKIVCFVTGVPGAGKTLVGLDIVHEKDAFGGTETNTAYFTGNVPLANVLREALSRDEYIRQQQLYSSGVIIDRPRKKDSFQKVKTKIQNLHQFIKDNIPRTEAPFERIVVFDEAQRCWNAKQFSNKAKQNENRERKPVTNVEKSEAELLFEFMDRHDGWAVMIALIGGGQEINTGEGGIEEWGKAISNKYTHWNVHVSPQLIAGDETTNHQKIFQDITHLSITKSEYLHLTVSQRTFKAANLNNWVNAVINNDTTKAKSIADSIGEIYPLYITRDLSKAKNWLRNKQAGSKRTGLITSSGGVRLKPYGVHVREEVDEALWFLNDELDVRSSNFLETAATEYKVQGLEIDWACVCWDADLRREKNKWDFKNFSGTNWQENKGSQERMFLLNTYRVLLTRAREGIIVFVPEGDATDYTRLPEFYNPIFAYLKDCGMQEI